MTDQTIPDVTDDDRRLAYEWAKSVESTTNPWSDRTLAVARVLQALLPPTSRPTLADMTDEERRACQWMQADVRNFDRRMVVTEVRTSSADLIERDGERWNVTLDRVTPRPDLPRLEWPGDTEPAPAPALPDGWRLADHKENGRVIVTNPTPTRDGRVYYVLPSADPRGYDWLWCDPDRLTYIDQEADQ